MKGLIKNNWYKIIAHLKLFIGVMTAAGILTAVFDNENPSLIIGFLYFSIVGFPHTTAIGLCKNNAGNWNKYILTFPIRRQTVVASLFVSQAAGIVLGTVSAAVVMSVSIGIHGFPFDKNTDVLLLFSSATGISLFTSSFFFLLITNDGKNRTEAMGVISLLTGIGIVMGMITMLNSIIEKPATDIQLVTSALIILLSAAAFYLLSYFETAALYRKKEF